MSQQRRAVLVVGDVMLDRQLEGEMTRISPEAPTPVVVQKTVTESLGGAGNVARNIVSLGGVAYLMGVIGDDQAGQQITQLAVSCGIQACLPRGGGPTIQKTRIMCDGQLVLRTDIESPQLGNTEELVAGLSYILHENTDVGVIVFSDYAKGVCTPDLVRSVRQLAALHNIPVYVDCRPEVVERYRGVTLLKPNLAEAQEMLSQLGVIHPGLCTADNFTRCDTVCALLRERLSLGWCVVTAGAYGCIYYDPADSRNHSFQATVREVYDVCGAGDTVMAALAVACLENKGPAAAAAFAMYAAGLAVRKPGVYTVPRDEVEEHRYRETGWAAKLMDWEQLQWFIARRRRMGHRIVLTNGCYDGIHSGHIELFRYAAQQGDTLVVAYNDDESLRVLKGTARPWVPESYRGSHLAQQECVDAVIRFCGATVADTEKLVRGIKPDVLVKGADAAANPIPGADFVADRGGVVALAPVKFNLSSSLAGMGDKF